MALNRDQSVSILYDLAMTMAGETRPHPLATTMLQRLMSHTGCACAAVLLHPQASPGGTPAAPRVYAAIGNSILNALEGETVAWPAGLLAGQDGESAQGWFPGGTKYRHALSLNLPELGHILLFSARAPEQPEESKRVLAPILAKFARSLRHCIESEASSQALIQNEARFRGMLESTSDWVWEANGAGIITFSSNKVLDLLGYTPEEALGHTPFDFMPPGEARHAIWSFRDIAGSRRPFHTLENIFLNRDGHTVILETSGVPVFDTDGKLSGYRGISRDITARRQTADELAKAKEAAEAANRAKNVFLASMSHELRTPLNTILGYAQLIEMQDGQPQGTATSASEIRQAGQNLLTLLNDILDFTRMESGCMEMQIETFLIAEVIEACLAQNAGMAAWKKVPVNCIAPCSQCRITADRFNLLHVLNNLVSNAIKYNREGGQVRISCNAPAGGRVRIAVADTGPGIDPALQAQLFQPFNRLGAEMGQIAGAGIGLVVARQLVESMGGEIGAESTPGGGSTFWVELPSPTGNGETPNCQCVRAPAVNHGNIQGARVLVAEDYPPNQAVLQMQLASLGCEVDIAADGAEALAKWTEARHDLILADLNMPVMDGLALARAVREQEAGSGRHTPIICITAAALPSELEHCLDAGMDDTLTKPVTLEKLRDMLTHSIGTRATPAHAEHGTADEDVVLDFDCLYRILGEVNPDQGCRLAATFVESAGKGLEQLASGTDGAAVAREMHRQKSSARTVGALRYAKQADILEQQAKSGETGNIAASLAALREGLAEVETASASLRKATQNRANNRPASVDYGSLLVVDDDPVVLQQMAAMLSVLGVKEVLTASNGLDALKLLSERNGRLDTLVCDLNMPAMDGVELIRLFGRTGFSGGLILMSGADEKVLSTVGKLADLQGLRVLGQVQKPVMPVQMAGLLSLAATPRARKRQSAAVAEVSPQSIRDGIDRDEFSIWFQPKVDAASLRPVGAEALVRWRHPSRGILSPNAFIGVAEREGLAGDLSQVLACKALMEGARLHNAGFPLTIAINLSGLWLDDLMLPDFILATTQAAGLRTSDVILEVTETGVMKDLTTALDVLTRLRLKGFGLSIDDFGIGYSSFEQLDRIPFTELKLDRSFVSKGVVDATARAILQSSLDIAHRMALSTVAEGVETEADLELVRKMGCDRVQGYLIAKPMPTEDLIAWLRGPKNKRPSA